MKQQLSRIDLLKEYQAAPESTLFTQETVAAIRDCSLATMERDRWIGSGVPYLKIGRQVRYRKADIQKWLDEQCAVSSTSEFSCK